MTIEQSLNAYADSVPEDALFEKIAGDLRSAGFSINPASLPSDFTALLLQRIHDIDEAKFASAGIGRGDDYIAKQSVRTDEISWIYDDSAAGVGWNKWAERLRCYLNRALLLGLFSFESHFSHYGKGDFYKRHFDAFVGDKNRILSIVVYLNPIWGESDGGELVIYQNEADIKGIKVAPLNGTVVVFLSEEFPHEVLPAMRDRYAIAGWYRANTSTATKVDPPI